LPGVAKRRRGSGGRGSSAKPEEKDDGQALVAPSPVPVGPGGDYLKGRIYFGSGSHMYSWKVQ